jgi:hypothetical protein
VGSGGDESLFDAGSGGEAGEEAGEGVRVCDQEAFCGLFQEVKGEGGDNLGVEVARSGLQQEAVKVNHTFVVQSCVP